MFYSPKCVFVSSQMWVDSHHWFRKFGIGVISHGNEIPTLGENNSEYVKYIVQDIVGDVAAMLNHWRVWGYEQREVDMTHQQDGDRL